MLIILVFCSFFNIKARNKNATTLELNKGGWQWEKVSNVKYAVIKDQMELSIPKKALGIMGNTFVLDFKWADNVPADGDVMYFLGKGDSAPNARFKYRYSHAEK